MKILIKKSLLEELKKSTDDRQRKYGEEKHVDTVEVHRKNGTVYYRRQTVGRKRQESKKRGIKQEEENASNSSIHSRNSAGTRTKGDTVLYVGADGKQHNGLIIDVSKNDVTVVNEKKEKITIPHINVKKVLTKVNDSDEIHNLYDARRLQSTFRDGTDGLQPVDCDNMNTLWAKAEQARKDFSKYSDEVIGKFKDLNPILLKRSTLKGQDRAKEKLETDEMDNRKWGKSYEIVDDRNKEKPIYHCRTLRDVDGHTFCCKSIKEVSKMLDYFIGDNKNIIRIKNNFANPSAVGYSDINMNIRLPNGTIAEIQLNTMANMVAKEKYGHALYEVYRSISNNPKYKGVADAMAEAQKKLYGFSNELSKNGTFPAEITDPFKASYKPYGEAIRMNVRAALPSIKLAYAENAINDKTYEHFMELVKKLD